MFRIPVYTYQSGLYHLVHIMLRIISIPGNKLENQTKERGKNTPEHEDGYAKKGGNDTII